MRLAEARFSTDLDLLHLGEVSPDVAISELRRYAAYARKTKIDKSLHGLEATLNYVGGCINPLLNGTRDTGRWRPGGGWRD